MCTEWLFDKLVPVLDDLIVRKVKLTSFVADNDNTMNLLGDLLNQKYSFLIRVPCTAHIIQLVARKALKVSRMKRVLETTKAIIKQYDTTKALRLKLMQAQDDNNQKKLIKPNTTRWSSELMASKRLLLLRRWVNAFTPQTDEYWEHLGYMCSFLQPFQLATDVIQQDRALLVDVYQQFIMLLQHCGSFNQHPFLAKIAAKTKAIINSHWNGMVKKEPVIACAMLGLKPTSMFSAIDVFNAQEFIIEYGMNYISFYKLGRSGASEDDIKQSLTGQLSDFIGRSGVFRSCDEKSVDLQKYHAQTANATGTPENPYLRLWNLYITVAPELSAVAVALLSIPPSEAAVERSFSLQKLVHNPRRNRLGDTFVHNEMMIKFNSRALNRKFRRYGRPEEVQYDDSDVSDVSGLFDEHKSILHSDDEDDENSDVINDGSDADDGDIDADDDLPDELAADDEKDDRSQMDDDDADDDADADDADDADDVQSVDSSKSRSSGSSQYFPENIVGEQYVNGKKQYKIQWKGYTDESDETWQLASEYDDDEEHVTKLVAPWNRQKKQSKYVVKHHGKKKGK